MGCHAALLHHERHGRGVDVAATTAHHQTGQRGEAHRGVDHLAVFDGCNGGAVADMAGDDLGLLVVETQKFTGALRHIAVRRTVETVAANVVFGVPFIGHGVEISVVRHRAMESIVEHCHLRHVGHKLVYSLDAGQMALVVHGGQFDQALYSLLHLGGHEATLLEEVAALHHAMPHGPYLVEALDGAHLGIEQAFEYQLHALLVGGQLGHDLLFVAICELHLDESLIQSDTLHAALSQHTLVGHVVQLVFNRTASTVQNQYFHSLEL